jgi:hypothetical protein
MLTVKGLGSISLLYIKMSKDPNQSGDALFFMFGSGVLSREKTQELGTTLYKQTKKASYQWLGSTIPRLE